MQKINDAECAASYSYSQFFGHVKIVHSYQSFQDGNILELQHKDLIADIAN